MTPVNFFNSALVSYSLFERDRSVGRLRWSFRPEETQQRCDQKRDRVKSASNEMRFEVRVNLFFHKFGFLIEAVRLFFIAGSYGRGGGVGRERGVGANLGVGVAVAVAVAVVVGVAVGVGVGEADCAQYLPPVFWAIRGCRPRTCRPGVGVGASSPPQTIISLPLHTAV
jgi:hypothetical protein